MGRPTHILPLEVVNQMWEAYQREQSERAVARAAGISRKAAHRYIHYGDEYRGIEAFRTRLANVNKKAADKKDRDAVKVRAESIQLIAEAKAKYWQALRAKQIDPADLKPGDLDTILRLEMFLVGEPDKVTEQRLVTVEAPKLPPDLIEKMAEMMLRYEMETGICLVNTSEAIDADFKALPAPKDAPKEPPANESAA